MDTGTIEELPHPNALDAEAALERILRAAGTGEESLLAGLIESTDDAVFVVDAERRLVLISDRAEAITGVSRDEVLGRDCLTLFKCRACLVECGVFTHGSTDDVPLVLYGPNGKDVSVRKTGRVVRNDDGEVVGAVEAFRLAGDVVPGVDAGGAAWGGASHLIAMLGRGVMMVDANFVIRRVSDALAELVGRMPEELIDRPAAELLGDELCEPDGAFRKALQRGDRREGWRAVLQHADGRWLPFSLTAAPVPDAGVCGEDPGGTVLMLRPEASAEEGGRDGRSVRFEGMIGRSHSMKHIFELIDHLRDSDATVLITGESGTGKELVARAVHARSNRANRPFVAVNCGALPEHLLESELFGHARGAFTGATRDKPGRFEVVQDGTILLDEVGDLPQPLQVKLLRVLQERTFERLGENTSRPFRARILAATNMDLAQAVTRRTFRDDLFYRLNVVRIQIPPLRERRDDLELLITHLLDAIGRQRSRALRLSPGAMRTLMAYDWPGNVRQLENAFEYANAVCDGQTIHVEDLPPELTSSPSVPAMPPATPSGETPPGLPLNAASPSPAPPSPAPASTAPAAPRRPRLGPYPDRERILAALETTHYRRGDAAQLLGISRTTLWRRMKELGF
ncbi:MAG: sigma 54-interacting transcriptional regulator [Gemmatimonadota bacterium]